MPDRAWQVANMAGGLRDAQRQRGGDYRGIGHRADLICYWLVNQAARSGYEASLQAAVLAAEDDERERELAKELNNVIVGLVAGSVSNDRFVQMMKAANKRSTKARMAADPPERPAPNAIPFNTVLSVLEAMFNEQASSATFKAVWDAFKAFTSIPVRGVSSAGELLLFEYGISQSVGVAAGSAGFARLVRQFEVTDADGVPDHAEQLSCDWTFDPTRLSLDAPATAIWSDGDAITWYDEVESDPVFNELLVNDDPLVVTTDLFSTE